MKPRFLLAVAAAPLLLTSCVVEHDAYYHHPYHTYHPYHAYHHDVVYEHGPYRRDVVVEAAPVGVVYYRDTRGRYYWRHRNRVYVEYY